MLGKQQKPVTILIVEDSPTQAQALKYVLEQNDFQTLTARNGEEGLDLTRRSHPSLIISDVMMPGIDGFEMCKCIKGDQLLKKIPIILLTALSGPQDIVKGLECGTDAFITKPYDEKYLLSQIASIFENTLSEHSERDSATVKVCVAGQEYSIASNRQHILNLLLSTYEAAIYKNRELEKAQNDLRTLNEQLAQQLQMLKQADVQIKLLNENLKQRAVELEASNKELEAFSYSVSHDLRAPLRGIDGFSSILLDEYADKLEEGGKDYLKHIQSSSQLMARLIEDILTISRITRTRLDMEIVDLSELAEEVRSELKMAHPQRQVDFEITPGLKAYGDRYLLKLVFDNLLGNAFKFTGKRDRALIGFGKKDVDGQPAYFVKDNGAGFDMAYVDKLFKPFQRLHSEQEFPGTGIGLASVLRIINRHNGRVWAEGEKNKGATFYFTLSRKE